MDRVKAEIPHTIFVSDMSSAIGSRDLTTESLYDHFGVIYGGAQKNFGTSGLTFAIVREDVMRRVKEIHTRTKVPIPAMMDWPRTAAASDYFINTPSNLAIWTSQQMCSHMLSKGGIQHYE